MNEKNCQNIKLIALDMDGTLLSSEQAISKENFDALLAAHGRGIAIAIASGRSPQEIAGYLKYIPGIPVHILGLNGAFIRMINGEDRITCLPGDVFSKCVEMTEALGFRYFFYTDDGLYSNEPDDKIRVTRTRGVKGEQALSFAGRTLKFVASSPDTETLAALRGEIAKLDVAISSSRHQNFEVNAKGVDKGSALRALADYLGIPQKSVMAVGDQENDITMLRYAGVPVAMGNAIEQVRRLAVYETGHHNEHGVAQAIRHFIE